MSDSHDVLEAYRHDVRLLGKRHPVTMHLPLVIKLARQCHAPGVPLPDLIQEGSLGLLRAAEKFDPARGVRFSTYAALWIRAYLLRYLVQNWRLVRLGKSVTERRLFFNLRKQQRRLEAEGLPSDAPELAARLRASWRKIEEMDVRLGRSEPSIDAPFVGGHAGSPEREERSYLDLLAAPAEERPDVHVEREEERRLVAERVSEFVAGLRGREQTLFRERWLSETPLTLRELGARFGISRERTRQIEARLLARLRRHVARRPSGGALH